MNRLLILITLFSGICSAKDIEPSKNSELASILSHMTVLASEQGTKIIKAPIGEAKCWGGVNSCVDVKLFVVLDPESLGQPAVLFELPASKGWEFVEWNDRLSFVIKTALPGSNISESERDKWRPIFYEVNLSEYRDQLSYDVLEKPYQQMQNIQKKNMPEGL